MPAVLASILSRRMLFSKENIEVEIGIFIHVVRLTSVERVTTN
jgi:hypothetical protein